MNYLITASFLLLVISPAYYFLLRFSERYVINRALIVLGVVAVCALPYVNFSSPAPVVTKSIKSSISYVESSVSTSKAADLALPPVQRSVVEKVPSVDAPTEVLRTGVPIATQPVDYWWYGYLIGAFLMGLVLLFRLFSLLSLHLRSRPKSGYRLLANGAGEGQAFTFGRTIYVSEAVAEDSDFSHVLAHERVHARQFHSMDILLGEVFLCLFWFHPVAWWLRARMRANLEYLVDRHVVDRGADKRAYQLALVRQSQETSHLALALPFSEPTLRSRISRLTGVPEYRVVAILAAVAFLFWLGVAGLVINGAESETPPTDQYLAASATDDAWVEYYNWNLPEELTSFELYTDRMLTGEEYLRVRAMLAKAPGVKLFVYKNAFDPGPSLEIRYDNEEVGRVTIPKENTAGNIYMIGLETRGTALVATNHFAPISMEFWAQHQTPSGGRGMLVYTTATQTGSTNDITELTAEDFKDGPIVYFNRRRIDLSKDPLTEAGNPPGKFLVNNVAVTDLGREEWTKVRVEGRPLKSPRQRLARLAGLIDPATGQPETQLGKFVKHGVTYKSYWADPGTFREWYEKIEISENRECKCRYNDRMVSKDFLLDTEFGPDALVQIAYDDGTTDAISLMVLDDYPAGSPYLPNAATAGNSPTFTYDESEAQQEFHLYLKRLPTPAELRQIRPYLRDFPGHELRLYESCTNRPGNLTINLGKPTETKRGFGAWETGGVFQQPHQFQLTRFGNSGDLITTHGQVEWPAGAPNRNIVIRLNGKWIGIDEEEQPVYDLAELDEPIATDRFRCLMYGDQLPQGREPEWMIVYHDGGPEKMDYVIETLEQHGYKDRPTTFYLNDRSVSFEEFVKTDGGEGAYVLIGGMPRRSGSPIYVQLVDPATR